MIEDELRALLTDRAGELPDNPTRVTEVRSRVRTTRRRRTAGAALSLVLLALAGFGLTRLPGSPDALPTGVPPGPWFTENGRVAPIPGYTYADMVQLTGPDQRFSLSSGQPLRRLVVVRCAERGTLDMRNLGPGGPTLRVDCSRPAGDAFEGAAILEPDAVERLWAQVSGPSIENIGYVPSSAGQWFVVFLDAIAPERLPPWDSPERLLLDGANGPAGGTVTVTIPKYRIALGVGSHFSPSAQCVEGVRLTLTARGGPFGELRCDQDSGLQRGWVSTDSTDVQKSTLDRLGLRPGDRVALTVRSTGRQTDQWRLVSLGY